VGDGPSVSYTPVDLRTHPAAVHSLLVADTVGNRPDSPAGPAADSPVGVLHIPACAERPSLKPSHFSSHRGLNSLLIATIGHKFADRPAKSSTESVSTPARI